MSHMERKHYKYDSAASFLCLSCGNKGGFESVVFDLSIIKCVKCGGGNLVEDDKEDKRVQQ